jgi:hypothetical protein
MTLLAAAPRTMIDAQASRWRQLVSQTGAACLTGANHVNGIFFQMD